MRVYGVSYRSKKKNHRIHKNDEETKHHVAGTTTRFVASSASSTFKVEYVADGAIYRQNFRTLSSPTTLKRAQFPV